MSKKNFNCLIASIFLILTGCNSDEKSVKGLGLVIVVIFLIFWLFSTCIPKFQELKIVRKFIKKIKQPIIYISNTLILLFAVLAVTSALQNDGINVLFGAIFGIGIVGFHYLKKWAESVDSGTNKVELKMFFMSITFIVTLGWLIFYGVKHLKI